MLREEARKEFEAARFENDPEIVSAVAGGKWAGAGLAA